MTFSRFAMLAVVLAIAGAGCVRLSRPPSESVIPKPISINVVQAETKVCASRFYSGRPDDPCWFLSPDDTTELMRLIQAASTTVWSPISEPGLGYKGLEVFLPTPNTLTTSSLAIVSVFQGKLSYNKDVAAFYDNRAYVDEPNPHFVYKMDVQRQIETWLISRGQTQLSIDVYRVIQNALHGS